MSQTHKEHLPSSLQYAFLVTAAVQFAGGIVIFFGLLVSPEEIGEDKLLLLLLLWTKRNLRPGQLISLFLGEL